MGDAFVAAQESVGGDAVSPERIDLAQFPGVLVDKVVVPVPAEIFAVLDKLDEPNWNSAIHLPPERDLGGDRAMLGLTFGSLIGEGFVAVQAKSVSDIESIGKRVLRLSEALGLASDVRPHSLAVIDSANRKEWDKVREELDATQQTVRSTMEKLRDDELAGLVSLGGWLRGTNVVTTFIAASFSEDKAELLHQPDLIGHFRKMIAELRGPAANSSRIRTIATGLARIEAIITDSDKLSEESVARVRDISREMLDEFYFQKAEIDQVSSPIN